MRNTRKNDPRPIKVKAISKARRRVRSSVTVKDEIARIGRHFRRYKKLYFGHGTENAEDEAAWLVGHVAGISPGSLDAHLADRLTPRQLQRIECLAAARVSTRKPLAYLINEAWFAGLKFYVDERVIVPRSLTAELIRDRFQPWIAPTRVRRILDLCTGSSCMAIALADVFPRAQIDASDISTDALAVAKINIRRHKLSRQVRPISSDLFAKLGRRRYDLIVCNPPYVSSAELKKLPSEYRHEPIGALVAGIDGTALIVRLLAEARTHLTAHGILVVETGNSCTRLAARFPELPFVWLTLSNGDESVFLLTAQQLANWKKHIPARL